jgi:hypothetical protein
MVSYMSASYRTSGLVMAGVWALTTLASAGTADAGAPTRPALGVAAGFAVPSGDRSFVPTLNWGFYADIPIVDSLVIAPSVILYDLTQQGSTSGTSAVDVSVNMKFVVNLGSVGLYAGGTVGMTSTNELDPHLGLLGGASVVLSSNFELFGQFSYRWVLGNERAFQNAQVSVGPLIRF